MSRMLRASHNRLLFPERGAVVREIIRAAACRRFETLGPPLPPAGDRESPTELHASDLAASRLGLGVDSVLAVAKGAAGLASGSAALTADAAHSAADMLSSAVVYLCVDKAREPPDEDHPYGHGKVESLGTLVVACALLATGGAMGVHSGMGLYELLNGATDATAAATAATAAAEAAAVAAEAAAAAPEVSSGLLAGTFSGASGSPEFMALAAGVAGVSIGAKEALYRYTLAAGEASRNALLVASAWHHRSDALSSVVALAGAGGALCGFPLLDPGAGLVVSAMIAKVGTDAAFEATQVRDSHGVFGRAVVFPGV